MMRASNQSSMSFSHITKAATEKLKTRVQSAWFNADGTPKENYIWKISDNTPNIEELNGETDYKLEVKHSIVDSILSFLSFGLYTPTTITIYR